MKSWGVYPLQKPPGGNPVDKYKTRKFDVVGERPTTKHIQVSRTDLTVEKLYHLKSQSKFSEPSRTERREPFDCTTGISGFNM